MQNPFENLVGINPEVLNETEQWGGRFECQTFRCLSAVAVANYNLKTKVLSWTCDEGHLNEMEWHE